MSLKSHKNTAEVDCRWAIGLLFAEGIAYVTKIENYPEKCFYPESGKEPLYFESKRTADYYAFGMLLNGYPAAVMEVPKAIIIHNVYFIGCYFRNLLTMCILCAIIAFVRR